MADLEQQSMEPKSLYMIIRPDETPNPNRFTLYKITNVNLSHDEPKQPPRATAILQFPCHTFCPGMGFVALGSKLYCIGGLDHSAKVYGVDLNTIETCYKENRSPFVRVADMHKELVHFGDEKFCLAMIRRPRRDYNDDNSKYEFALLTFEVVKQKSSKADDQLLCWADIYDFRAVETSDDALLSWTKFVYCFAA
ncbi:hypothetical protein COLO4_16987 [Corchorus olitorius]|uniref:Kelch repeat type 1 n=1 Tax=Corchorus olitorius TaxID=93759 RepID=A0A1R3JER0_9ROSI|nr:hypothetical protein COLO4_16987 [Corchorus olitorius]